MRIVFLLLTPIFVLCQSCNNGEKGCEGVWVIYCNGLLWVPLADCSSKDMICSSGLCASSSETPPNATYKRANINNPSGTTTTVSGICTETGRKPISGTNCMFRQCFADLTHIDILCSSGYHYEDNQKECVKGQCNSTETTNYEAVIPLTITPTMTTSAIGGICTQAGRIPIPGTNCRFYQCFADLTYIDIKCSPGYHYDDGQKECVVGQCDSAETSTTDVVTSTVTSTTIGGICTQAGRIPIPGTNCMFRQCLDDLTYTDNKCSLGYHYDDGQKECVVGQCESAETSTTDVVTSTLTSTTIGGICTQAGRIPIPGTNCMFRQCLNDLTYTDIKCSLGYHYDDSQKECVVGQCDSAETRTTDVVTSTITSTTSGRICTEAGRIAIPGTSCMFRQCFADLTYIDIKCSHGYHYDDSQKECVIGQCDLAHTTSTDVETLTTTIGGICKEAGRISIPRTNCMFRQCFADLTYIDIKCSHGYHYDDSQKECVIGQCDSVEYPPSYLLIPIIKTTTADGICTEAGRIPIPGTNCMFRQCFDDLTYIDIKCSTGYHYGVSQRACIIGPCDSADTTTIDVVRSTTTIGGICTEAGRIPIPGTNCMFRQCFDDLTFIDIECSTGYHYENSQKECIIGQCGLAETTTSDVVTTIITTTPGGICTETGRIPVPGNYCMFRQCFDNLTYIDIECSHGYHYDDSVKACIIGECYSAKTTATPGVVTSTTTPTTIGGICTEAGRIPIPGNNCMFRQCFDDLTYIDIMCSFGYHYEDILKECIIGQCYSSKTTVTTTDEVTSTTTRSTFAGIYTEAGRMPISGTNCMFRQCFDDLTYTDVVCSSGYHYDDSQKECVPGKCW